MEQQLQKACDLVKNITLSSRSENGPPLYNSIDTIEKTLVPIVHKLLCSNTEDATNRIPAREDLVSISKYLSELYIHHAINNRVAHRLKKIVEKFERLLPESSQHVEESIVKLITPEDDTNGLDLTTLKIVSNLLEDSVLARKVLETHFTTFTSTLSISLTEGVTSIDETAIHCATNSSAMQACLLGAKMCLQLCQHMGEKLKSVLWSEGNESSQCCASGDVCQPDGAEVQSLHKILQSLLDMISNKQFSKECSLMAGAALAMVLNSATKKSQAEGIALNMLNLHSQCQVWSPEMAVNTPDNSKLDIGNVSLKCKCPTGDVTTRKFSQLTLLRGLLTCSKNESVLQDKAVLVDVLFPMICDMCHQLRDMQYHAIQVLTYWLQTTKKELPNLHKPKETLTDASGDTTREYHRIFSPESEVVDSVLSIAWQSWQSPVDGVPELVKSVVALLLDAYHEENRLLGICESKLYKTISTRLQHSPWHVKGRYPLLCTVIPYCSSAELLASYPALPSHLLECLETNFLAAAATEVYSVCLRNLKDNSRTVKRRKSDEETSPFSPKKEWEVHWQEVVVAGLCSDNELVRYHTANCWLPLTVKFLPDSYKMMMVALQSVDETISQTRVLHALIVLLHQARMNQISGEDWMEQYWAQITSALWHCDEDIRSDAFSLICISPKKSQLPSEVEVQLLQSFISDNLNCDSASFRNKLSKSIRAVLVRLRDGSLALLRQLKKEESRGSAKDAVKMVQLTLNMVVRFLQMVLDTVVCSLFPGSCYQRKKTSLELISLLYEILLPGGKTSNRVKTAGSTEALLEWAKTDHQFDMLSERTAGLILTCIQDGSNDIRNQAFHLLVTYYPPILPSSVAFPTTCGNEILCSGLKLISHPKAHMADAGALLCKLTFTKSILQAHENRPTPDADETGNSGSHDNQLPPGIDVFIERLLDILKYQFDCAQHNFVSAAALTPMHGVILTIRRCLTEDTSILHSVSSNNHDKWLGIVENILSMLQEIVNFILGVLSGRKTEEEEAAARNLAPSFGQMGEAIDGLIGALSHVQLGSEEGKEQEIAVSDEHQIVLSCCWLNLKESSQLLGALVESSPLCDEDSKPGLLEYSHLEKIAEVMIGILTKCRHKGAIEGCNQGFSRFCAKLLSSPNQKFASLPHKLLDRVLTILTTEGGESSFTKKSAGLPLVVESIIVAEPKGRERYLLQHAMQRLTSIAKQPLPDNPDDNLDLPQTHALNIMRALFRCSAINTDMHAYVGDAVEYAISGFASSFWAIRNCCMQLFGTLVSRIFGQKRVADEHSNLNSLSASEFVFRYPSLKEFLLAEMKQAVKIPPTSPEIMEQGNDGSREGVNVEDFLSNNKEIILIPTMHPVLSVLAKLGLGVEQDTAKRTLEDFMEPIMRLLSNPIYSIRELASRAILPLIAEGQAVEKALEVIRMLPQQPGDSASTNQTHGYLLLVDALIQTAIDGKSVCVDDSKSLLTVFNQVSWLASANNSCAIVRALFVNICNKLIEWMQISQCDDVCELVSWLRDEAQTYAVNPPEYQVGIPALNKAMTHTLLLVSPSPSDQVSSIIHLLSSSHQDTRLAALEYTLTRPTNQNLTNELYRRHWELLTHCVLIEIDIQCIQAGLNLWLHTLCNVSDEDRMNGAKSIVQKDNLMEVWRQLRAMADGKRGSTLCATSLPVLSSIVRDHIVAGFVENINLNTWSEWMLQYSDPTQIETIRLGVAKSLQICGVTVLSTACESREEINIPSALCILSAGLRLLQDEQSDIRRESAVFAAQIPREADCIQHASIGSNQGIQILVSYICKHTTWSLDCYTALTRLLKGPITPSKVIWQQGEIRAVHLFEQESVNMYAEGVMEAKCLYKHLMTMSELIHASDPESLQDWFRTRWHRAVKSLQETVTALDDVLIMEGDSYRATSQSKVFQVVARQLLYIQLLQHVAKLTSMSQDKACEKDFKTVDGLIETLDKATDVHLLLKEFLPARISSKTNGHATDATETIDEEMISRETNGHATDATETIDEEMVTALEEPNQ